jgi:hypothetical protein
MVSPNKVVRLLGDAQVKFVLMGLHGVGGYRQRARATQDVDVLVRKKDHAKAVWELAKGFPKLRVKEVSGMTMLLDPATGESSIDVIKPFCPLFQAVFRNAVMAPGGYAIPTLEMAVALKYAAMVSQTREAENKMQDAVDFISIVKRNHTQLDRSKLRRLAEKVYVGGGRNAERLVADALAGRTIKV